MRKILTIVFFCFISQISMFSQEKYSGQVVSSKDRTPVAFANVVILANDSSFLAGGVTDEKGIYSIEIEEGKIPQLFKVTCIGYESLIQPMSLYPQEGGDSCTESTYRSTSGSDSLGQT